MATKISWLTQSKARIELLISNGLNEDGTSTWYSQYESLSEESSNNNNHRNVVQQLLPKVREVVSREFIKEEELYLKQRKSRKDADEKWIREVSVSGTLSDKIAALSLIIQESPLHNLKSLDTMLEYVRKDQRSAQLAIEALKDLFTHSVLPDRKLISFAARDFSDSKITLTHALVYWYEDQLISRIKVFVDGLEEGLKSNIEFFKKLCMDVVCDMLVSKPEQEARLLSLLVNKLGDPSKAAVYKCTKLLEKVLTTHPVMKSVVVREVRQFMNRPSLPSRALYTAITFLTYIRFSKTDGDVALQLVECYISLFEKTVKQEDFGSKLLSSLLHGINRAYPYLQSRESLVQYVDPLFKISHNENFATAVQALTLISYIALGSIAEQKQVSRSLAKKSSKKGSDKGVDPVEEGVIADSASTVDAIVNRFYRSLYAILFTDQIASRTRNTMFFRLLFRSMKSDPSDLRLLSFIKKLCMISLHCQSAIAAGILLMVAEVCGQRKSILGLLNGTKLISTTDSADTTSEKYAASPDSQLFDSYDASKREPLYASKSAPKLWEKHLLAHHYHPSVKAFANSFFQPPHAIVYNGDPIADFNVSAFLNRFAYKNPKQKAAGGDDKFKGPMKNGTVADEEPINMLFRDEVSGDISLDSVAPDKQFFYRYFGERSQLLSEGKLKVRSKRKDAEGDEEENDEEEMDAFADQLATDMIRTHNRTADPDFEEGEDGLFPNIDDDDDDDFDDDDDDDDDDDQDEDDDEDDDDEGEFTTWSKAVKNKVKGADFAEEDEDEEDAMDFESVPKSGKKSVINKSITTKKQSKKLSSIARENDDDSDDEDGAYQLDEYTGDDDEAEDYEEVMPVPMKTNKKLKAVDRMIVSTEVSKPTKRSNGDAEGTTKKKKAKKMDESMADFADADEYEGQVDEAMSRFGSVEPVDAAYGGGGGVDFGQGGNDDDDDDEAFFNDKNSGKKGTKGKKNVMKKGLGRLRRF